MLPRTYSLVRGYRKLEQSLDKEQSRQGTSSENVKTRVTSPPSPPFRHVKWKRARIKKSGAPSSEQSGVIIEKIVSYFSFFFHLLQSINYIKNGYDFFLLEDSLESQGNFVPEGRHDILVEAIRRPEHCARVRAAAQRVGIKLYFGVSQ